MTSHLVPVDIPAALTDLGLEFTVTGNEAKALCPHPDHDDSSPSWSVNLDTGMTNCFSCGYGGSFVKLVELVRGISYQDAAVWVRRRKVTDIADGKTRESKGRKRPAKASLADLWEFGEMYPRDELDFRGFRYEDAKHFNLLWDHGRQGWVIPVYTPGDGEFIGYQFKPKHGTEGVPAFHPPGMRKAGSLFGSLECADSGVLIVVESPLDVVRLRAQGFGCAVALFGAHMSAGQADLIMEKFGTVILALDDDDAGRKGVSRALSLLKSIDVRVFAYGHPLRLGTYHVHPEVSGRDPGNLTRDEFQWGIDRATHGFRTGFM